MTVSITTLADYQSLTASAKHAVTLFYSDSNDSHLIFASVFENLASIYNDNSNICFYRINVDASSDIAPSVGVTTFPTVKFHDQGNIVQEIVGAQKGVLAGHITQYGDAWQAMA
jgi:thioredoxin-like negative regulator of GroEL